VFIFVKHILQQFVSYVHLFVCGPIQLVQAFFQLHPLPLFLLAHIQEFFHAFIGAFIHLEQTGVEEEKDAAQGVDLAGLGWHLDFLEVFGRLGGDLGVVVLQTLVELELEGLQIKVAHDQLELGLQVGGYLVLHALRIFKRAVHQDLHVVEVDEVDVELLHLHLEQFGYDSAHEAGAKCLRGWQLDPREVLERRAGGHASVDDAHEVAVELHIVDFGEQAHVFARKHFALKQ